MISTSTYSTFTTTFQSTTSGLVGTLGVRVIDSAGATIVARSTSGITEPIAGSGVYFATVDLTVLAVSPPSGHYVVVWDDGSTAAGHVKAEDLFLHTIAFDLRAIKATDTRGLGASAENLNVGLVVT
jgi:hypothetical protein